MGTTFPPESGHGVTRAGVIPNPLSTPTPQHQPRPRSYRVEYKRDLRPGWGLDWHLHTAGDGHWCVGGREAGAFRSETEAHAAGRRWVETGRVA